MVVIEGGRFPSAGGMANRTVVIEIIFNMIGVGYGGEIRLMTREAIRGSALVTLVVASDTRL